MKFSSVLRWPVALLIPLTLAWKIAVPLYNPDDLKEELVEFFEKEGFNVVVVDRMLNYVPIIQATTASCHLLIARLTPDGSNRNLFERFPAIRIANSSSFAVISIPNNQFYGRWSIISGRGFFANWD